MWNINEKGWILKMALPASNVHLNLDLNFVVFFSFLIFLLVLSNLRGNSVTWL